MLVGIVCTLLLLFIVAALQASCLRLRCQGFNAGPNTRTNVYVMQDAARKAKVHAVHSPSKAAGDRKTRDLEKQLQDCDSKLEAAQGHVHELTLGLNASNDVIQVWTAFTPSTCLYQDGHDLLCNIRHASTLYQEPQHCQQGLISILLVWESPRGRT